MEVSTRHKPIIKVIEEEYEIPQLKRSRRISALLPHDYNETDKSYPVLYLNDGQNLFDDNAPFGNWAIDRSLEKLAGRGNQDIIIIAIDHGGEERLSEYSPFFNDRLGEGEGTIYLNFLINRLKPYVRKKFRVLESRDSTGIGGSSMGGLISLYAGMAHPEVFGKMMVFSPSLWISPEIFEMARKFIPKEKTDIYLYAGGKESQKHLSNVIHMMSALFEKADKRPKLRMTLSVNPEGMHSENYWGKEFPEALRWLYFNKN